MAFTPLQILTGISTGMNLLGGLSAKSSANRAARKAQEAANFNAEIIERDIDLLTKQREIINANLEIDQARAKEIFARDVTGGARAAYGYANIDINMGSAVDVMRANAAEFDYQQSVEQFNNAVTNMQIDDAIEETRLQAQLTRMSGEANASGLRAQGTTSLIRSFGTAAQTASTLFT